MPEPFEVLTMGRIGVDLYPLQVGVGLRRGRELRQVPRRQRRQRRGGRGPATAGAPRSSPAPATTRSARSCTTALRGFGVDDRYVTAVPDLPTPVTFCEIFPPDDFPLYFYRLPKAPDLEIHRRGAGPRRHPRGGGVLGDGHRPVRGAEPRRATLAALRGPRPGRGITVLDLDYRPMFWPSREEARRWVQQALPHVTVAVGNLDECETAVGEREPLAAAQALHERGVELAVVKQGPKGVLARRRPDRASRCRRCRSRWSTASAPATRSAARCATGCWPAGTLERMMRFANAAGAHRRVPAGLLRRHARRRPRSRPCSRRPRRWMSGYRVTAERHLAARTRRPAGDRRGRGRGARRRARCSATTAG